MDHDRYGLDGMSVYSQAVDLDPLTGEQLSEQEARCQFAFEPNTVVFAILAVCFVVFFMIEAYVFG